MQRNIRIQTKPNDGDKYVKIKIDQSFDFLEVLSLKLTPTDVYRKFASNYGVIAGRVIANGGFGVPNAKVSVFVPIDDSESNSIIRDLYPYKNTKDVNYEGVRYNLLPDDKQSNCHVPIGTFPNKRKLLDNDIWLEIYEKYYKFTTTTNFAGDYMIFGVPTGNQIMHMDVDLSDMEYISLKPYDLIEQGYREDLFESRTTYKGSNDLGSLVQLQSKDYALNVIPFWGDLEEGEVGVNRVDFNLDLEIIPNSVFFGSIFTDSKKASVRKKCGARKGLGRNCDLSTGVGRIEILRRVSSNSNETEIIEGEAKNIDENGNWSFTVPMNLDRYVTDEFGNLIPSEDPNVGIPTKTLVRFRITLEEHAGKLKNRTASYLVPNMYNRFEFGNDTPDFEFFEMRWKKVYTVTNYIPRYQKNIDTANTKKYTGIKDVGECDNISPFPFNRVSIAPTFFFGILCLLINLLAFILEIINFILELIIFQLVIRFICFVSHPFNSGRRGACRCRGCYDMENFLRTEPYDYVPDGWVANGCNTCIDCAICYDGGDAGTTTYSFNETILYPSYVDPISITQGTGATPSTTFSPVNIGGALFEITTDGSGNISSVVILNQGIFTLAPFYSLNTTAGDLGPGSTVYQFILTVGNFVILSQDTNSTDGIYNNLNETLDYLYGTGVGNGAEFDITITNGIISSINIDPGSGGLGYNIYDPASPAAENFILLSGVIGGTANKVFAFTNTAFTTTQTIPFSPSIGGSYTVDCTTVDINDDCRDECQTCPLTLYRFECNGVFFDDILDWVRCVNENIAEESGIVKYNFYNDWVIGSLYSFLFDYKAKFKKKGKSFERFCDFDCRDYNEPIPSPGDPNYSHRKNRCYTSIIAEERIFNGIPASPGDCSYGDYFIEYVTSPPLTPGNHGLIVEYEGNFYYSARYDVEINTAEAGPPISGGKDLSVCDKYKLLFATNIIELGSMVSCDLDGEPYIIDRLEATSYQKDDGTGTLFDFFDCFTACPINRNGIQLMSQAGVSIEFAEADRIGTSPSILLTGDDEEGYILNGAEELIPDYDGNRGIIIFDRDDIILRRKLCENFNYYNTVGAYSSSVYPSNPLTQPHLEEPYIAPDVSNEILEFTIDTCAGFDDNDQNTCLLNGFEGPTTRMHPYYTYFGIRQGQSSLDKLRKFYFDRCID
jgi:hypothetical protein